MAVRSELQNRIANTPPVAILLVMLSTLTGAVLFIACANVAGFTHQPRTSPRMP
jgi:hypothetical protein